MHGLLQWKQFKSGAGNIRTSFTSLNSFCAAFLSACALSTVLCIENMKSQSLCSQESVHIVKWRQAQHTRQLSTCMSEHRFDASSSCSFSSVLSLTCVTRVYSLLIPAACFVRAVWLASSFERARISSDSLHSAAATNMFAQHSAVTR